MQLWMLNNQEGATICRLSCVHIESIILNCIFCTVKLLLLELIKEHWWKTCCKMADAWIGHALRINPLTHYTLHTTHRHVDMNLHWLTVWLRPRVVLINNSIGLGGSRGEEDARACACLSTVSASSKYANKQNGNISKCTQTKLKYKVNSTNQLSDCVTLRAFSVKSAGPWSTLMTS